MGKSGKEWEKAGQVGVIGRDWVLSSIATEGRRERVGETWGECIGLTPVRETTSQNGNLI